MRSEITLVQPISAAIAVSVGVKPRLLPPRSPGSSITDSRSRVATSERVWLGQFALSFWVTVVFCRTSAMVSLPSVHLVCDFARYAITSALSCGFGSPTKLPM